MDVQRIFYAERAKKVPHLFTFVMKFKTASLLEVLEQLVKIKAVKLTFLFH